MQKVKYSKLGRLIFFIKSYFLYPLTITFPSFYIIIIPLNFLHTLEFHFPSGVTSQLKKKTREVFNFIMGTLRR